MQVIAMGLVGLRPEHCAEDPAGSGMHVPQKRSLWGARLRDHGNVSHGLALIGAPATGGFLARGRALTLTFHLLRLCFGPPSIGAGALLLQIPRRGSPICQDVDRAPVGGDDSTNIDSIGIGMLADPRAGRAYAVATIVGGSSDNAGYSRSQIPFRGRLQRIPDPVVQLGDDAAVDDGGRAHFHVDRQHEPSQAHGSRGPALTIANW